MKFDRDGVLSYNQPVKIFITGGTGFIGSHLVQHLSSDRETETFVLVRKPEKAAGLKLPNIHWLKGDIFSLPPLPSGLDIVFHLAGLTKSLKSADYYTVNQRGTASFIQTILKLKNAPKVVHLSSLAASGPSAPGRAVREDDPPRPVDHYGFSKLRGEEEALKFKNAFPVVIVRVGAVFGPGDTDFLNYLRLIAKGILPSFGPADKMFSLSYVKDLVRALLLCAQKDLRSGEVFNVADPRPYSWDDIGRSAGAVLGKKLFRVKIPLPAVFLATLCSELASACTRKPSIINLDKFKEMKQAGWVADVRKAEELLGFRTFYSLKEGLLETITWYRENGRL